MQKLLSAIYGSVTELRGYHMRGGGTGAVPRFGETATSLFPDLKTDADEALALAESMMMLHRRIAVALEQAYGDRDWVSGLRETPPPADRAHG